MTPFEAFRIYNALKLHFKSGSYDAFKYNFKTSVTEKSYWKRRDKRFFAKLARNFVSDREGLIHFYVANFINGVDWVGDMTGTDHYESFMKDLESMSYQFTSDITELSLEYPEFNQLLAVNEGSMPVIIKQYIAGKVSINTVILLDILTGFVSRADRSITDTVVWPEVRDLLLRYKPFVRRIGMQHQKLVNHVLDAFDK